MAVKKFNPVTPGLRQKTVIYSDILSENAPLKSLTKGVKSKSGRSSAGVISVRRLGGGHKKKMRVIDFKRNKFGVPAKVASIEYDPNRTAYIALLHYRDGEKRYILAPETLAVGDMVMSDESCEIKTGNAMKLKNIPVGTIVHCVEMLPGQGAKICRSAGGQVQLTGFEGAYSALKMPSGELRLIHSECMATVGKVSNADHMNEVIGSRKKSGKGSVHQCGGVV